jgi:hypothetical protein
LVEFELLRASGELASVVERDTAFPLGRFTFRAEFHIAIEVPDRLGDFAASEMFPASPIVGLGRRRVSVDPVVGDF